MKAIFKENKALKIICLLAFIAASYAIFTFGQTYIHSDSATPILLGKSIFRNKRLLPDSWNPANGELQIFSIVPFSEITSLLITTKASPES